MFTKGITMEEYTKNRIPNVFSVRPTWIQQGHIAPMNYSDKPITANIYQVAIVIKDRKEYHKSNTDNCNLFTVIATQEDGIMDLIDKWYNSWSDSGIPYELYDTQINIVMRNVIVHQLGIIQFSYCW